MPNRNSHANRTPERTCVVCRNKRVVNELVSFATLREGLIFDLDRSLQIRKNYVCPSNECLRGLEKWKKRYAKKTFGAAFAL